MNKRSDRMHQPGSDRTGPDRLRDEGLQDNSHEADDIREANENIRKAQGDDATGSSDDARGGNRPRFDRDR